MAASYLDGVRRLLCSWGCLVDVDGVGEELSCSAFLQEPTIFPAIRGVGRNEFSVLLRFLRL